LKQTAYFGHRHFNPNLPCKKRKRSYEVVVAVSVIVAQGLAAWKEKEKRKKKRKTNRKTKKKWKPAV
jgi:hypothetical protein